MRCEWARDGHHNSHTWIPDVSTLSQEFIDLAQCGGRLKLVLERLILGQAKLNQALASRRRHFERTTMELID
jgi:hypothetical protein